MRIRVGWSWLGTGICERSESAQERRIALYKKQSSSSYGWERSWGGMECEWWMELGWDGAMSGGWSWGGMGI